MNLSIEFYASLMKYLPPGKSRFRREIKVDDGLGLSRLIEQYHISPEEAHLVLVNGLFVCAKTAPNASWLRAMSYQSGHR